MEQDIGAPSLAYNEMSKAGEWPLLKALKGGAREMRKPQFLPRNPREGDAAYNFRQERSFLYPGFKDAVDSLTALPFQRPITLTNGENLPESLAAIFENCDREGTALHDFGHETDEDGVTYGILHILVDYPAISGETNALEDRVLDARPYFCAVSPTDLVRWTEAVDASGRRELSEVRILTKADGMALDGSREVTYEQLRIITRTTWELHRKDPGMSTWARTSGGTHTFGRVPLVTVYYDRAGRMKATPPMLDLAWVNLRHFQSQSDQDNAMCFGRIPQLFGAGFSEQEANSFKAVGPGMVLFGQNPSARIGAIAGNEAALAAGRQHDRDMIEQMVALGAQPLVETTSATATGEARQDRRATCKRQEWAMALANGLTAAYRLAAEMVDVELPEGFAVSINGDFVLAAQSSAHMQALQAMRAARDLSHETFIAEVKRRGVLAATVDAKQEAERLEAEGGDLRSDFGFVPNGAPEPVEDPPEDPEKPPGKEADGKQRTAEE